MESLNRKAGYHHGNLREELLKASVSLIEKKGPNGFTLAEAARLLGVSTAAPYKHFKNREALIFAVATVGFKKLEKNINAAINKSGHSSYQALLGVGYAVIDFYEKNRGHYAAMYQVSQNITQQYNFDRLSYGILDNLTLVCNRLLGKDEHSQTARSAQTSCHIWALAHGVVLTYRQCSNVKPMPDDTPRDLFRSGLEQYLKGYGITPD